MNTQAKPDPGILRSLLEYLREEKPSDALSKQTARVLRAVENLSPQMRSLAQKAKQWAELGRSVSEMLTPDPQPQSQPAAQQPQPQPTQSQPTGAPQTDSLSQLIELLRPLPGTMESVRNHLEAFSGGPLPSAPSPARLTPEEEVDRQYRIRDEQNRRRKEAWKKKPGWYKVMSRTSDIFPSVGKTYQTGKKWYRLYKEANRFLKTRSRTSKPKPQPQGPNPFSPAPIQTATTTTTLPPISPQVVAANQAAVAARSPKFTRPTLPKQGGNAVNPQQSPWEKVRTLAQNRQNEAIRQMTPPPIVLPPEVPEAPKASPDVVSPTMPTPRAVMTPPVAPPTKAPMSTPPLLTPTPSTLPTSAGAVIPTVGNRTGTGEAGPSGGDMVTLARDILNELRAVRLAIERGGEANLTTEEKGLHFDPKSYGKEFKSIWNAGPPQDFPNSPPTSTDPGRGDSFGNKMKDAEMALTIIQTGMKVAAAVV